MIEVVQDVPENVIDLSATGKVSRLGYRVDYPRGEGIWIYHAR